MKKRWETKEDAKAYVGNCISNNGPFGLAYCAACDFLGLSGFKYRNDIEQFCKMVEYEVAVFFGCTPTRQIRHI